MRLHTKQQRDQALWQRHVDYLIRFIENPANSEDVDRMKVRDRLEMAEPELTRVSSSDYQQSLVGTIGADPMRAP